MFKLYKIPFRDWNAVAIESNSGGAVSLNFIKSLLGIETFSAGRAKTKMTSFKLYKIPFRDWNSVDSDNLTSKSNSFKLYKIPFRDWNSFLPVARKFPG